MSLWAPLSLSLSPLVFIALPEGAMMSAMTSLDYRFCHSDRAHPPPSRLPDQVQRTKSYTKKLPIFLPVRVIRVSQAWGQRLRGEGEVGAGCKREKKKKKKGEKD